MNDVEHQSRRWRPHEALPRRRQRPAAQADRDMILMDPRMPRLDGIEATRRLAARELAGPRGDGQLALELLLLRCSFANQVDGNVFQFRGGVAL